MVGLLHRLKARFDFEILEICQPKSSGEIGLRMMKSMNKTLLVKTGWELSQASSSIWHLLLSSKYLNSSSLRTVQPKLQDSQLWKGILKTRDLLSKGTCYQIFNGLSVNTWSEPWIPTLNNFKPRAVQQMNEAFPCQKVTNLIMQFPRTWDIHKLESLFDLDSISENYKIPLSHNNHRQDLLIWIPNHFGRFSFKSTYHLEARGFSTPLQNFPCQVLKKMSKLKIHDRHKLLVWKIIWNILSTRVRLSHILPNPQDEEVLCPFCNCEEESLLHLFNQCTFSRILWESKQLAFELGFTID